MVLLSLKSRIPSTFWRFGLVGIGGLFVDVAILYAGLWGLGFSWFWSKVFSFLAAASFTWWLNRHFTFGKSNKSLLFEWASFLMTNAFGGFVNFSVYSVIMAQDYPYIWMPAVATAAGSLSGLSFNYLSSKHLVFNQISEQEILHADSSIAESPPYPRLLFMVTVLVSVAFGVAALSLGMDARWDLKNYHWYNDWAVVNGLTSRDWLVSEIARFNNPMLDVPFALTVEWLPARAIGFGMGMAHGLNFLPLSAIAWHLSTLARPRHRLLVSSTLALVGICGAGGLAEIGMAFCDNVLSFGVLTSIWIVVAKWNKIVPESNWKSLVWTVVAGMPAGLAFGFKQPFAVYSVGLSVAFLIIAIPFFRRIRTSLCFCAGVLLGFAVTGGFWAVYLWKVFGNSLLPYFNQIILSPLGSPLAYGEPNHIPHTLVDKLLFVFEFSFNSQLCGETYFRDFRILSLVTLIGLVAIARFWRKQPHPFTHYGPTVWLLAAAFVSYAIWVPLFSIYRYLVPLEMLAPLLSVAAIGLLPMGKRTRLGAAISLVVLLAVSTVPGHSQRVPWEEKAVAVNAPNTMIK